MKIVKKPADAPLSFETVELKQPLVSDFLQAERISGQSDGYRFSLAVLAQVGTFDGKTLVAEDLEKLTSTDFLALSRVINSDGSAPATEPEKSPEE